MRGAKVDPYPDVEAFSFYISAFNELGTCRNSGASTGQIPFTAIADYARIYEVDDFEDFMYIIRVMDKEYLRLNKNGT